MSKVSSNIRDIVSRAAVSYLERVGLLQDKECVTNVDLELKLRKRNDLPEVYWAGVSFQDDALGEDLKRQEIISCFVGHGSRGYLESQLLDQMDFILGNGLNEDWVIYDAVVDNSFITRIMKQVGIKEVKITAPVTQLQIPQEFRAKYFVVSNQFKVTLYTHATQSKRAGVELILALDEAGFNNMAAPIQTIESDKGMCLGLVSEYLGGGFQLESLVQTSIRDLFDFGGDPANAGGDLSLEMKRLGETVAKLHTYLSEIYGSVPMDVKTFKDALTDSLTGIKESRQVNERLEALEGVSDVGALFRVHGNLDASSLIRTEMGWFVCDNGLLIEEVTQSPFFDICKVLNSIDEIAQSILSEQSLADGDRLKILTNAWLKRNKEAFLLGYLSGVEGRKIVPEDSEEFFNLAFVAGCL